jgi:DNA modification methylase
MGANQLDRVLLYMKLNLNYVDVIVKRWEEHFGMNAEIIQ